MNNWKTSTAGLLALVSVGALIAKKVITGQPITDTDLGLLITALTGAGLLAAKDHNK